MIQIDADIIAAVQEIIARTIRGTALIDILREHRQILADLCQLLLDTIMDAHILSLDEGIDIENHIRALHRCGLQMESRVVAHDKSRFRLTRNRIIDLTCDIVAVDDQLYRTLQLVGDRTIRRECRHHHHAGKHGRQHQHTYTSFKNHDCSGLLYSKK